MVSVLGNDYSLNIRSQFRVTQLPRGTRSSDSSQRQCQARHDPRQTFSTVQVGDSVLILDAECVHEGNRNCLDRRKRRLDLVA